METTISKLVVKFSSTWAGPCGGVEAWLPLCELMGCAGQSSFPREVKLGQTGLEAEPRQKSVHWSCKLAVGREVNKSTT